ncbi:cytochrome P450, partial [Salmonella sp. s55044]|uniref:cytochrome P450 n=1 Tax=Salmonella sp. s55044 TaxID=3159677 RepID=UPI003980246B
KDYPHDILAHILETKAQDGIIKAEDMDQMIDEFTTFFVAGQETTGQLLSFTCEFVGRNPDVYKKLQEEIDRVIGDKEDITYNDTCQLEYMNLVFKEVLRIAPPVVEVQRTNANDSIINGLTIPAGSNIGLSIYALGRDERY